jgi:hypothetical protein
MNRVVFAGIALTCLALCPWTVAQEPAAKDKDEALDSLIESLARPKGAGNSGGKIDENRKPAAKKAKGEAGPEAKPRPEASKPGAPSSGTAQKVKPAQAGKPGSGEVSSKDKELDDLLDKLGQTKDEPAHDEPRRGQPQADRPDEPAPSDPGKEGPDKKEPRDKARKPDLQGQDKDLDARLEELAGKRRKKNRSQEQEGAGAMGQLIKEMRDVEQRLSKPETGEDTQSRQKRIVKQIETMIEQMKQQSGGGSGSMAMRMVKQAGQKPGDKPGQTPGANAGGAPAMKPAKPSDRHALAGGKDVWGHLPAELRQEMENVFKEEALSSKYELIRRYYLSVAKQRLVRGE